MDDHKKRDVVGRCCGCTSSLPANQLIRIHKDGNHANLDWYWICFQCHEAYWHAGFTEDRIWQDLDWHVAKHPENLSGNNASGSKLDEVFDPRRNDKRKIQLEDIADLVYELAFKKPKEIWECLEK